MLDLVTIECPYCWQTFKVTVDCSAGDQCYVEDCHVCCNPILLIIRVDLDGQLRVVQTWRENP